jgi:hypothetical protein
MGRFPSSSQAKFLCCKPFERPTYFAFIVAAHRNSTHIGLDRSPYPVVPESPNTGGRVPHQLSPRRPRRLRWRRRRPRRCGPPGPRARRTTLACWTLPVVAMIPVPVVGSAPARVPLITRAPAIAGRRGGGRLSPGAANQPEAAQRQRATRQRAARPPNPLLYSRHLSRISLRPESSNQ